MCCKILTGKTLKKCTKLARSLARSSLRAVAPDFRVIVAFRVALALEKEAIPSKSDFERTEACGYGKIAREREWEHVRSLGAFARRPLAVLRAPRTDRSYAYETQTEAPIKRFHLLYNSQF